MSKKLECHTKLFTVEQKIIAEQLTQHENNQLTQHENNQLTQHENNQLTQHEIVRPENRSKTDHQHKVWSQLGTVNSGVIVQDRKMG
jgi:hypothetical protein